MKQEVKAPDSDVILSHFKSLDYVIMKGKITTWHGGHVVGWNAAAPSVIRKPYTVEKLEKFIEDNDMPVFIQDQSPHIDSFKIMIRL